MEDRRCAVKALSFLFVTLSFYLLLWQCSILFFDLPNYYYARLIEVLALVLFVLLAKYTPMRFEKMGIVTDRKTLFFSLLLGATIAAGGVGVMAIVGHFRGAVFSLHLRGDISRVTYFLVAPFQEILAKSVMLYSFEMIFEDKHPHLANLMSAAAFGAFHVVYGIRMMLLAMLLSLLTGCLFRRVRCVWGCSLVHFALGFFPLCFGLGLNL